MKYITATDPEYQPSTDIPALYLKSSPWFPMCVGSMGFPEFSKLDLSSIPISVQRCPYEWHSFAPRKHDKINVVKIRTNPRLPITTWCVLFGWLPIPMDYHHVPHFNGHLAVWVYPIRHSQLLSRSLEAAVQRPATWHHSTWRCSNGEPRDMALERVPKALTWFTICLICTYCNKTI